MKLKYTLASLCLATTLSTNAATINFNLAGLNNPTGAATNGGDTRQYEYTTSGGEVTIIYTLDISMASPVSLANDFEFNALFRRPGVLTAELPPTGSNMVAGETLSITIDSITANTGFTLGSFTKSNTVGIAGDNRDGNEQATFSVNGGTSFTLGGIASSGISTLTDNRFRDFNSAGDTLLFETTAGNAGRLNLRELAFTAITIPEPSSTALLGLGGLALILRRRR